MEFQVATYRRPRRLPPSRPCVFHRLSFRFALKQMPSESRQVLGVYVLQIVVRIFLTVLVPLYGGYADASRNDLMIYVLIAAAFSLWAYGQPGPQQLWQTGGVAGVIKGWLVMSAAVLIIAAPAFAIGYYVLRPEPV